MSPGNTMKIATKDGKDKLAELPAEAFALGTLLELAQRTPFFEPAGSFVGRHVDVSVAENLYNARGIAMYRAKVAAMRSDVERVRINALGEVTDPNIDLGNLMTRRIASRAEVPWYEAYDLIGKEAYDAVINAREPVRMKEFMHWNERERAAGDARRDFGSLGVAISLIKLEDIEAAKLREYVSYLWFEVLPIWLKGGGRFTAMRVKDASTQSSINIQYAYLTEGALSNQKEFDDGKFEALLTRLRLD